MVQYLLIAAFVIGVFVLIAAMFSRARGSYRITTNILRDKTRILDEEFGIAFAWGGERNEVGDYVYQLRTDQEGMKDKVYGEKDLIPVSVHLNALGQGAIYITRSLVSKLYRKVDVVDMQAEVKSLKELVDYWQTAAKLATANKDAEVEKSITHAERLGKAYRPTKPKGAM